MSKGMKWKFVSHKICDAFEKWGRAKWAKVTRKEARNYLLKNHKDDLAKFAARYKKGVPVVQLLDEFAIDDLMSDIIFQQLDQLEFYRGLKEHDEAFVNTEHVYKLAHALYEANCYARQCEQEFLRKAKAKAEAKWKEENDAAVMEDLAKNLSDEDRERMGKETADIIDEQVMDELHPKGNEDGLQK